MADQLQQIRQWAEGVLDDGEDLVAAMKVSPRGHNTAIAARRNGSTIPARVVTGQFNKAEAAGLRLAPNMAIVLTQERLLTVKVRFSIGGAIKYFEGLLSALPVSQIESMEARRLGLGGLLIITARGGTRFGLECRAAQARDFAAAFNRLAGGSRAVAFLKHSHCSITAGRLITVRFSSHDQSSLRAIGALVSFAGRRGCHSPGCSLVLR